jgi:hypothetical protein
MDNRIDDKTLEILGKLQYMRIVIESVEAQILEAKQALPTVDIDE